VIAVVREEEEDTATVEATVGVGFGSIVKFRVADHASVACPTGLVAAAGRLVDGLSNVVKRVEVFEPDDVCLVGEIALYQ
jgi:hypothetical protein